MARREAKITIEADPAGTPENKKNRDAGKVFLLTEWDAETAENWANRAILTIGNSGARIDHIRGLGMAGIAFLGIQALLGVQSELAIQLVNELMACVQIQESAITRAVTRDDIEEVQTRWRLKQEAFAIHTGFSWAELQSMLTLEIRRLALSLIPTSQELSDKSSQPDSQPKQNSEQPSA